MSRSTSLGDRSTNVGRAVGFSSDLVAKYEGFCVCAALELRRAPLFLNYLN